MRIAVLADIHGNLRALEAVHADLIKRSAEVIVNLGDTVSGPLQATATADWLMQQDWVHIRGNHDRQLVDRAPAEMGLSDQAAHAQLNGRQLDWIANLPPTRMLTDDVLLCHGSPGSDLEYLLEQVDGDRVRLASPEQIEGRLANVPASLIFCGHTHLPRIVSLPGGVWVVNPGSVGLQAYDDTVPTKHYVENGSPHARYAIVDWDGKTARADFMAIDYDWESAAREAARANRPDWAHALLSNSPQNGAWVAATSRAVTFGN
jgi:putative phosphoesterase